MRHCVYPFNTTDEHRRTLAANVDVFYSPQNIKTWLRLKNMKFESKFYNELKRNTPQIRWTRLENSSVFGTPDLLGYNTNQHFFTVELKVTKSNSLRFSPHQIAFHKLHPKNSFILAKHLASSRVKLYEGKKIMELVACGLKLDACCLGLGLEACGLYLSSLGAWSFRYSRRVGLQV